MRTTGRAAAGTCFFLHPCPTINANPTTANPKPFANRPSIPYLALEYLTLDWMHTAAHKPFFLLTVHASIPLNPMQKFELTRHLINIAEIINMLKKQPI